MEEVNIVIIGAGVIGLGIAYELSKFTSEIIVLEKLDSFGQETSSRNSEVIHAGLYYPPSSLKAETCLRGRSLLYELCTRYNIPCKKLGKLVVASDEWDLRRIEEIYENARKCGVGNLKFLEAGEIKKLEPSLSAKKGFLSPESGIINSHALMDFFYNQAKQRGVTFSFSTEVIGIDKGTSNYLITVKESKGGVFSFKGNTVINAAGLYSDKIAQMAGIDIEKYSYRINYCKGQYFRIKNPKKFSINRLIYPPATKLDLGIHLTPDLAGSLRLGPDAKYVGKIDYSLNEPDKEFFCSYVQKFLPTLNADDLAPDTAGIRPKLQKEGEDFRDFVIQEESNKGLAGFVNLIGIESPGLTSCLAIAEMVRNFILLI